MSTITETPPVEREEEWDENEYDDHNVCHILAMDSSRMLCGSPSTQGVSPLSDGLTDAVCSCRWPRCRRCLALLLEGVT